MPEDQERLVLADRVHKYNAPIEFLFYALTTDLAWWLGLHPGEVEPVVLEATKFDRVVWSSFWPVSPNDTIEFDLSEATALRFRWYTDSPPDARGIGITRQRLNQKFGGAVAFAAFVGRSGTGKLCDVPFGPMLRCDSVVLRPPTAVDVDGRRALGHDAEILRMFGVSTPVDPSLTTDQAAAWVVSLGRDGSIEWIVEHDGRFLGVARLHSFESGGRCRYAVGFFDPAKLGQGLGRIVTRLVLRHAFDDLGLEEVELVVLDFNERAQRCYRSCGFHEVARVRSDVFDGGRIANDVVMRVTPSRLSEHSGARR